MLLLWIGSTGLIYPTLAHEYISRSSCCASRGCGRCVDQLLQLLHDDECQDSVRSTQWSVERLGIKNQGDIRQSQPRGGPTLHQEHRAFATHAFSDDLDHLKPVRLRLSSERHVASSLTVDPLAALWILLFSTSAGAQAVVATVPANREASACVRISSGS
jgi:hypothetical protein